MIKKDPNDRVTTEKYKGWINIFKPIALLIVGVFIFNPVSSYGSEGKDHVFPWGYCTWYVASKVYVPYGGDAKKWYNNADEMGFKVYERGKKPVKDCIVVFNGTGPYPKDYGHVALVEKVSGSEIRISEMNYKGRGVKSERTISINDGNIRGFVFPKQAIKIKYEKSDKKKYEKYKKKYKNSKIWYD